MENVDLINLDKIKRRSYIIGFTFGLFFGLLIGITISLIILSLLGINDYTDILFNLK